MVIESLLFPVLRSWLLFDWSVWLSKEKVGTVGCTLWLALSKRIKILFFLWQIPPPLHTEIVVQFYPWSKFYFLLFQTHYHTLPYPKTYLPWQQPTPVVDFGDSLFLNPPTPQLLCPTVNSLSTLPNSSPQLSTAPMTPLPVGEINQVNKIPAFLCAAH